MAPFYKLNILRASPSALLHRFGEVKIETSRDRNGTFEPAIVKKRQNDISDFDEKIISMYAKGMTLQGIQEHIKDIYGVEVSPTTISNITDKVMSLAAEWQARPLSPVYAIVFFDASYYHVRNEGKVVNKAALRKVTKNRAVFPTDEALTKILYMAIQDVMKKWTQCLCPTVL